MKDKKDRTINREKTDVAKEKVVEILKHYEDSLSDGYGYYTEDVQAKLSNIANKIISALDIINRKEAID